MEDAVEKDILSVEQLYQLLIKAFSDQGIPADKAVFPAYDGPISFRDILDKAKKRFDQESIDKDNQFFVNLRVSLNHILTSHAVSRFIDNIEAIYHGSFNGALLEDDSPAHKLTETFKLVALAHVFSHHEVELQELRGYKVIQGLLDYYKPLLELPREAFQGLLNKEWQHVKKHSRESRLANRLPGKHRRAYEDALKTQASGAEYELWEIYYRSRLMLDFISGMTDQYALEQYQSLMVAS
ncbi:MAG: dGTPase [Phenylobacterium sp.]